VQARVNKRGCQTFEDLKVAVTEELAGLSKRTISNLYTSMKKRINIVIERGGGRTGY
jgi:hypothetical protein